MSDTRRPRPRATLRGDAAECAGRVGQIWLSVTIALPWTRYIQTGVFVSSPVGLHWKNFVRPWPW